MGVVACEYVSILFTSFIVCRVRPSTQGALSWRFSRFWTRLTVVGATAFNAVERFVAILPRVTIVLTAHALWNVVFS